MALALASCATGPVLPYCPASESPTPSADQPCGRDPQWSDFRQRVSELFVPQAGSLLVRIHLDGAARIADACAVRGYGSGQFTARRRLAELLSSREAALSGPLCAADSTIEVNRAAAIDEHIEIIERDCQRQSTSDGQFLQCLDTAQRRRGEVWVYDSGAGYRRHRIFEAEGEASSPRSALLACTRRGPAAGSGPLPPIGIARPGVDLERCMESQGWREIR